MLTGKIHRATVTHAALHYVGSITIDGALLEAADMLPGERVSVVAVNADPASALTEGLTRPPLAVAAPLAKPDIHLYHN